MDQLTKVSRFQDEVNRAKRYAEIYELYYIQGLSSKSISEKTGYAHNSIPRILRIFEAENPQIAEEMKKKGKEITPEDYKNLQRQLSELKSQLKAEKLRADFYEEMVAFGKEVYGIDLKKAGAK